MSIFGDPIGKCDWCGAPKDEATDNTADVGITITTAPVGIKLYEYDGKNVCADCKRLLEDYSKVERIEEESRKIHEIVKRANRYY